MTNSKLVTLLMATLFLSLSACKKAASEGTPTPTPNPTATPQSTPTPQPTATPDPVITQNCIESISPTPVRVRGSGCPKGFVEKNYWDGGKVCVAKSSCEKAVHENFRCLPGDFPEIKRDCHPLEESIEYNGGAHYWPVDPSTLMFDDGRHGMYDAFGRRVSGNVVERTWDWTGSCPPKLCPVPRTNRKCTNPDVPPVHHFELSDEGEQPDGRRLYDSTQIVCDGPPGSPTENYCSKVWNGQKTGCCPTRPIEDPLRVACDYEATGIDPITRDAGPTWAVTYGAELERYGNNQFMYLVKHTDLNYDVDLWVCSNRIGEIPGACTKTKLPSGW